jgi:hypothetical protein
MAAQLETNPSEVLARLQSLGWEVSTRFSGGQYVAKGRNKATGQDVERTGRTPELALVGVLSFAQRAAEVRRMAALEKLGAWSFDWTPQREDIARAYRDAPPLDGKALPAWQALAAESMAQAQAVAQQIRVEPTDEPEPYESAREMADDVRQRQRLLVSRADAEHPVWTPEMVVAFRTVHDAVGHVQSGGDFTWRGENMAARFQMPLLSPLAQEAAFVEIIGRAAYNDHFRGLGPVKVCLLSEFLRPAQKGEGRHPHVPHGEDVSNVHAEQEQKEREQAALEQAQREKVWVQDLPQGPWDLPSVSDGWAQKPKVKFTGSFEEGGDEDHGPLSPETVEKLKDHGIEFTDWQPKIGGALDTSPSAWQKGDRVVVNAMGETAPHMTVNGLGRTLPISDFTDTYTGTVVSVDPLGEAVFVRFDDQPRPVRCEPSDLEREETGWNVAPDEWDAPGDTTIPGDWKMASPVVRPPYVDDYLRNLNPDELHEVPFEPDPDAGPGEQYLCPNPKCRFPIEPDDAEYAMETGHYECPKCHGEFNLDPEEQFTRAGLSLDEMGTIGEQVVYGLGLIPGLGAVEPAHTGGADVFPIDAILRAEDGQRYGVEIKTNHSQAQERFKVGTKRSRDAKIAYCNANGLKPALMGVRLNFYTDTADVFFRPGLTDTWIGNRQMAHVAKVDFSHLNPFRSPEEAEAADIPDQSLDSSDDAQWGGAEHGWQAA